MYDNDEYDLRPKPKVEQERKDTPNITLYMDKEVQELLREQARKENRSISKQVVHMFEYYLEHTK